MLREQALDPALHDRGSFRCGELLLDVYLQKYAAQQHAKGVSSVFVLVDTRAPATILGYYTLSAAQVGADQLSAPERKKLPAYPIPCFRMGRLACHHVRKGQGLGATLLGLAVDRCLQARAQVAAYALLVDAKSPGAAGFYQHHGFIPCADAPLTLYLPLGRPTP